MLKTLFNVEELYQCKHQHLSGSLASCMANWANSSYSQGCIRRMQLAAVNSYSGNMLPLFIESINLRWHH